MRYRVTQRKKFFFDSLRRGLFDPAIPFGVSFIPSVAEARTPPKGGRTSQATEERKRPLWGPLPHYPLDYQNYPDGIKLRNGTVLNRATKGIKARNEGIKPRNRTVLNRATKGIKVRNAPLRGEAPPARKGRFALL